MDNCTDKLRVRFAPSPTGYLHIGGARTALFNWLYARHCGGTFLLRIEDTDLERSTEQSTRQILDSMGWLKMNWDEPVVYQTERYELHKLYLAKLLQTGAAYKCFCSKERLEELREQAKQEGKLIVYDKHCLLCKEEAAQREAAGEPYVVRFNVPGEGVTVLDDMVYGRIEFDNAQIGDFVLARTDGSPTYILSNCIDDIDQKVTHVCRGEDHISNTPKQILIYKALGIEPPRFAHLPMILGPDKTRLSKRHGATSVMQFAEQGILPEALINFIALLGWAPEGGGEEVMSFEELISKFSLDKVNKSPAVFDYEKLLWMNGVYIRNMERSEIYARVIPLLEERFKGSPRLADRKWLERIIDLRVERSRTLNEFGDGLVYFFEPPSSFDEKGIKKHLSTPEQVELLRESGEQIEVTYKEVEHVTPQVLEDGMRAWCDLKGVKFGAAVHGVRLALTGLTATPGLFDVIDNLGREETKKRIDAAVKRFGEAAKA